MSGGYRASYRCPRVQRSQNQTEKLAPKSSDFGQAKLTKIGYVESATCGVRKDRVFGQASSQPGRLIQGGSRMRRSARTVLCGGRSAMVVLPRPLKVVEPYKDSRAYNHGQWRLPLAHIWAPMKFSHCSTLVAWGSVSRTRYAAQHHAHPKNILQMRGALWCRHCTAVIISADRIRCGPVKENCGRRGRDCWVDSSL